MHHRMQEAVTHPIVPYTIEQAHERTVSAVLGAPVADTVRLLCL